MKMSTSTERILEGVEVRAVNSIGIAYGQWMNVTDTDLLSADVSNAIADEIAEDTGTNVVTVGGQAYKFRNVDDAE